MARLKQAQPLIWVAIGIIALFIFVWGARQQGTLVNIDMDSTDQSAYMDYAKNMAETNWRFVGGRNRMPAYPALMSLFYTDGMTNDAFFALGKNVGIAIGLVCLGAIFFLFRQAAHSFDSLIATLVAAFTVFAYKAPYFQTEILFYTISLALFYLLLNFVKEPTLKTAVLAGAIGGLGHLTKASVMPAIALAVSLVVVQVFFESWQEFRKGSDRQPFKTIWMKVVHIVVLLGCFLLVVFPYIRTSKERFGRYFYNVNSTFYIWYDSWAEATQGTKAHGDRVGWPDMPPEEIPSLQKYLREHTTEQIIGRFTNGYHTLYTKVTQSYGYAEFLLVYLLVSVILIIQNRKLLAAIRPWVLLFILGYFLGHSLLYAWYVPIASGNRFILSLFLPALFLFVSLLSAAQAQDAKFNIFGRAVPASAVSPFMLLLLMSYLILIFPNRISTMYGGN